MRPVVGQNASCALGDCVKFWFLIYGGREGGKEGYACVTMSKVSTFMQHCQLHDSGRLRQSLYVQHVLKMIIHCQY